MLCYTISGILHYFVLYFTAYYMHDIQIWVILRSLYVSISSGKQRKTYAVYVVCYMLNCNYCFIDKVINQSVGFCCQDVGKQRIRIDNVAP